MNENIRNHSLQNSKLRLEDNEVKNNEYKPIEDRNLEKYKSFIQKKKSDNGLNPNFNNVQSAMYQTLNASTMSV